MESLKALYFITIMSCVLVLPKQTQECSIQPTTLAISANEEGVFKCSCNSSNQQTPVLIVWVFHNDVIETFPIKRHYSLEETISEDGVVTLTSTLTFVIDLMLASGFNDTPVDCIALVMNEDFTQDWIIHSATLYVYGLPAAPTDVHAKFTKSKMYVQWSHAEKNSEIEPIAYHVKITPMSVDPIETPSLVSIPGIYTQCILYEVCVTEETLAGIGHSACINTSSNISVLDAFNTSGSNSSSLLHTHPSSEIAEVFIVGCSSEEVPVHMQGEFHGTNVSVGNSNTSLELKLLVPDTFTPSDTVTLRLNFLQPRVEDLLGVQIENKESAVQLKCVHAEHSLADGCHIVIDCDGVSSAISIILRGEHPDNIIVNCTFFCVNCFLYGYANYHGVVANEPSIAESITFEQYATSSTSTPVPSSDLSPTTQGSIFITCFGLMLCLSCLRVI